MPASRKAATRLWSGAKSATTAPCNAKGAHSKTGTPSSAVLKSRRRTLFNSSAIVFGVAQVGSRAAAPSTSPMARLTKRLATKAASSLVEAAASAGHMKANCEYCRPAG